MADLNSLMIFARVVEANSFSEASRRLKMPVSTVSRRIADLEDELGVRLLVRSTRSLRLTEVGAEILEHAQQAAEIGKVVDNLASNHTLKILGVLRVSAPPSIAESLLSPLVGAFQMAHPQVRIQILITERMVDQVEEGIDIVFRIGALKDSTLIARKILTYRHQLVASPAYLKEHKSPKSPQELREHRLLAFSRWRPDARWNLAHINGNHKHALTFQPYLSMNDYAGLVVALLAGAGIGELPPIVQPRLLREGQLVEVMTKWRFRPFDLSVVHLGDRHIPRAVRVFKEFAADMAPKLFPALPS